MDNIVVHQASLVSQEFIQTLNDTWYLIPNWKWLALVIGTVLSFTLQPMLEAFIRKVKNASPWLNERTTFLSHFLRLPIEHSASWVLIGLGWLFFIDNLLLHLQLDKYLTILSKVVIAFHVIKLIYVSVEAFGNVLAGMAAKTATTMDDQLVPFITKTLKVTVVVFGALVALQNFGVNVMSLLAGLGIGGLAIAFAAQDTVANLFGSVTILMDHPFKIGDWIKVGDTEGTVEEVGFRSTRIRTFYNSAITIPNSVLAKEKIDNMGVRPKRRVRQILSVTYETSPDLLTDFCDRLKEVIQIDSKVERESIVVSFNNFNTSSLDVLMQFHYVGITEAAEELARTQKIFCDILTLAAMMKVDFAYPTTTLKVPGSFLKRDELS